MRAQAAQTAAEIPNPKPQLPGIGAGEGDEDQGDGGGEYEGRGQCKEHRFAAAGFNHFKYLPISSFSLSFVLSGIFARSVMSA